MDNLSRDEQVVVNFEDQQAIREAQGLLAGYLGTLTTVYKQSLIMSQLASTEINEHPLFSIVFYLLQWRNKEVRKKQIIFHTGGSKPIPRKRHEIV
ncbi:hypothetical protein AHAS_Ahas06G0140200 [Arachis hypogaea]